TTQSQFAGSRRHPQNRWMPPAHALPETFGIHAAIPPDAQSAAIIARLDMDLKRLRWIAIVFPVAIVVLLEIVRTLTIGDLPWQLRVLLDVMVVATFAVFGMITARTTASMNERLKRQNEELLALHGAS